MPRAPRRCPGDDYTCTEMVQPGQRYCIEHTIAWRDRTVSSQLTSGHAWRTLRTEVLVRDGYQCQIRYPSICTGHASQVDKIIPAARRRDLALDPANCRAACAPCNAHKARTTDQR